MNYHPSEYWIKYLITTRQFSFDQIIGMCTMLDLGGPSKEYLDRLQKELFDTMPYPFRGRVKSDNASQKFLKSEGITEGWHRTSSMKAAIDLLKQHRSRQLVETFILSPLKPQQIVDKVRGVTGEYLSLKVLSLFRHYFWNTTLLGVEDWGVYLQAKRASHNDWLRLAVTAKGPEGVRVLMWKTGAGARRHIDAATIFTEIRDIAYMKLKLMEHNPPSKDDSTAFRNYALSAKSAQEEVTASTAATQDLVDSFQAFQMRTLDDGVASIHSLDGTVSEAESVSGSEDKIEIDDY